MPPGAAREVRRSPEWRSISGRHVRETRFHRSRGKAAQRGRSWLASDVRVCPGTHAVCDLVGALGQCLFWSHTVEGSGSDTALSALRGGDCALLGELSLRGRFFEIPEDLFFRRIHSNASSQHTDLDWQSQFFKGRRGWVELPFWHVCLDHSRTILCSDLNLRDKISCFGMVLNRMFSGKRELLRELGRASKYLYQVKLLSSK